MGWAKVGQQCRNRAAEQLPGSPAQQLNRRRIEIYHVTVGVGDENCIPHRLDDVGASDRT